MRIVVIVAKYATGMRRRIAGQLINCFNQLINAQSRGVLMYTWAFWSGNNEVIVFFYKINDQTRSDRDKHSSELCL
jgi:hypothetical protein